jgi:hypothetical protein
MHLKNRQKVVNLDMFIHLSTLLVLCLTFNKLSTRDFWLDIVYCVYSVHCINLTAVVLFCWFFYDLSLVFVQGFPAEGLCEVWRCHCSLSRASGLHFPSSAVAEYMAVFRIRIHLIRIRIQHFRLNTDPHLIRILFGSRVLMTKNWEKFTAKKYKFCKFFFYFCWIYLSSWIQIRIPNPDTDPLS